MVDADTADKHDLKIGDELRTIAVTGDLKAKIAGIATFKVTNPGAAIVYFDTATAQREAARRHRPCSRTSPSPPTRASATPELKTARRRRPGHRPRTSSRRRRRPRTPTARTVGSFLDVMKYAMLGFAGIAFLVGIFLIVNTFSMLVAQRTREIGLMRAIGSSRKQVNRSVLVEAVLLGVVGSVLGVARGHRPRRRADEADGRHGHGAVHRATSPSPGRPRSIGHGRSASSSPSSPPTSRPAGPARSPRWPRCATPAPRPTAASGAAARRHRPGPHRRPAPPASARRPRADEGERGLAVPRPAASSSPSSASSSSARCSPARSSGCSAPCVLRLFGPVGRMAERNALRNPRRTGATGAALMIGLALVACLSVVGSSMVASATDELDKSVGADFIVQSEHRPARSCRRPRRPSGRPTGIAHVTELQGDRRRS